jgi:hypothetical protein
LSEKDGVIRPVLRKHAQDDDGGNAPATNLGAPSNSPQQDQKDDGPPTLKRTSSNPN